MYSYLLKIKSEKIEKGIIYFLLLCYCWHPRQQFLKSKKNLYESICKKDKILQDHKIKIRCISIVA